MPSAAATDPSTLANYDGRPVPWVTRWTNEVVKNLTYGVRMTRDGRPTIVYEDGNEFRDEHGVVWQREGIGRGGRPDWASVSTFRQRASMMKRRCQVCGHKITERPIRWLMPHDGLEEFDGETLTGQPPTCSACIPLALDLCPNLRRNGWQILKVLDYEVWGITGEAVLMTDEGPRRAIATFGYDEDYGPEFSLQCVLAKQMVVKLGTFVVEERHEGTNREAAS